MLLLLLGVGVGVVVFWTVDWAGQKHMPRLSLCLLVFFWALTCSTCLHLRPWPSSRKIPWCCNLSLPEDNASFNTMLQRWLISLSHKALSYCTCCCCLVLVALALLLSDAKFIIVSCGHAPRASSYNQLRPWTSSRKMSWGCNFLCQRTMLVLPCSECHGKLLFPCGWIPILAFYSGKKRIKIHI